jgi:hypothetical protein
LSEKYISQLKSQHAQQQVPWEYADFHEFLRERASESSESSSAS